ncbi:hypothetical protein HK096_002683, partial [Nowakowskiella sp. JEL0078]
MAQISAAYEERRIALIKADEDKLALSRRAEEEKHLITLKAAEEIQKIKNQASDEKRDAILKLEEISRQNISRLEEEKQNIIKRCENEKRLMMIKVEEDRQIVQKVASEELRISLNKAEEDKQFQLKKAEEERRSQIIKLDEDKIASIKKFEEEKQIQIERIEQKRKDSQEKMEFEIQNLIKRHEEEKQRIHIKIEDERQLLQKKYDDEKRSILKQCEDDKKNLQARLTQDLENQKQKLAQLGEQLKRIAQQSKEKDTNLKNKDDSMRERETSINKLESERINLQSEMARHTAQLENLRSETRVTIQSLEKSVQDKTQILSQKEKELLDLTVRLSQTTEKFDKQSDELKILRKESSNQQNILEGEIKAHKAQEAILKQEISNFQNQLQKCEGTLSENTKFLNQYRKDIQQYNETTIKLYSEINNLKEQNNKQSFQFEHVVQDRQAFQNEIHILTEKLNRTSQDLTIANITLKTQKESFDRVQSQLALSENNINDQQRQHKLQIRELTQTIEKSENLSRNNYEQLKLSEEYLRLQISKQNEDLVNENRELKRRLEYEEAALNARSELEVQLQHEITMNRNRLEQDCLTCKTQLENSLNEANEKSRLLGQARRRIHELEIDCTRFATITGEMEEYKAKCEQLENSNESLKFEIFELTESSQKKKHEIESLSENLNRLKASETRCDELSKELEQLQKILQTNQLDYRKLQIVNEKTNKDFSDLKLLICELGRSFGIKNFPNEKEPELSTSASRWFVGIISKFQQLQLENQHLLDEQDSIKAKNEEIIGLKSITDEQLEKTKTIILKLESKIQNHVSVHKEEIRKKQDRIQFFLKELQDQKIEIVKLDQKLKFVQESHSTIHKEKTDTEKRYVELYERFQKKTEISSDKAAILLTQVASLQKETKIFSSTREIESKRLTEANEDLRSCEIDRVHLKNLCISLQETKLKTQQLLDSANQTSQNLAIELEKTRTDFQALQNTHFRLNQDRETLLHQNQTAKSALLRSVSEIANSGDKIASLQLEIERFAQINSENEEKLLQNQRKQTVTEKEYSEHLETLTKQVNVLIEEKQWLVHANNKLLREIAVVKTKMRVLKESVCKIDGSVSDNSLDFWMTIKKLHDNVIFILNKCKKATLVLLDKGNDTRNRKCDKITDGVHIEWNDDSLQTSTRIMKYLENESREDICSDRQFAEQLEWI